MKILVTGACGYLGSVLVSILLCAGREVIALDNFMYQQAPLLDVCHLPNLTIVRGDCREGAMLQPLLAKADVIIPLAAIVGMPACDANKMTAWSTNLGAVRLLCEMASPEQRILFPTTNSGYGIGEPDKPCDENSPMKPLSLYARLKVKAESVVLDRENSISFRFATLFGASPKMRLDLLVNNFVYRAVHDKFVVLFEAHFRRNYLHVRDAARTFLWAMDHFDEMHGKPYNAGLSDANLTKRELCEKIREHVPGFYFTEAAVGEDADKRDYLISNDRILATGWRPRYSLDDGIVELIKACQMMDGPSQLRNA